MTPTQRQALEAAKAALEVSTTHFAKDRQEVLRARELITAALAEPEQEPVRWLVDDAVWERKPTTDDVQMWKDCGMKIMPTIRPLYTSPQPREWQELSEEGINETFRTAACKCLDGADSFRRAVYTAISAALRAKNEVNV